MAHGDVRSEFGSTEREMRQTLRRITLDLDARVAAARRLGVIAAVGFGAAPVRTPRGGRAAAGVGTSEPLPKSDMHDDAGEDGSREFLERLGYRPRHCVWELTLACDLRCAHCGTTGHRSRPDELATDEALQVVRQISDAGCTSVSLSGGEPTLRADWDLVAGALTARGIRVGLVTNGSSWTTDHTDRALAAGLCNVTFSLDGLEVAHDAVRRMPGSFARVVAAIEKCVETDLPVGVNTQINRLNKHTLERVWRLLADHGVSSWRIGVANPAGASGGRRDLVIRDDDLLWLVPQIAALKVSSPPELRIDPCDNLGYYGVYEQVLRDQGSRVSFWIGCRAGFQVVGIRSDGDVTGCLSLPDGGNTERRVEGNLRRRSLSEIWSGRDAFSHTRQFDASMLTGFCGECRFGDICRAGCPRAALSRTGSAFDNPLCFYRQAVVNDRWDLIPEGGVDRDATAVGTTRKKVDGGSGRPWNDRAPP